MTELLDSQTRLPWHHPAWTWIDTRIATNTLPHALLLQGQAGMGKKHFAQQLVNTVLCDDFQKKNSACGECRACHWSQAGTHPDFYFIFPEEGGRIRIDTIRELIHHLSKTGYVSCRKVVLIHEPESMQAGAANALLKTLEEPLGNFVLFILVSDQAFLLPATLRSRCQVIEFKPAFDQATQRWLSQALHSSDNVSEWLRLKEGAPLAVIDYHQKQLFEKENQWREQFQNLLLQQEAPLKIAKSWSEENSVQLLDFLQRELIERIQENIYSKQARHWFVLLTELQSAKQKILQKANLNIQLMMESLVIGMLG